MIKIFKKKIKNEETVDYEKRMTVFQKLCSPEATVIRKWIHILFTLLPVIAIFIEIYAPICDVYILDTMQTLRPADSIKYLDNAAFGAYAYLPATYLIVLIVCLVITVTLTLISMVCFYDEQKMIRSAKTTLCIGLVVSVLCPSIGLFTPAVIHTVGDHIGNVNTSFTSAIIMVALVTLYAIYLGFISLGDHQNIEGSFEAQYAERRSRLHFVLTCHKVELAVYTLAISALAIISLLSNILTINIKTETITITNHSYMGINLLADPQSLPTVGERMLAFFIFALLIICGTFAVMSIVSLASRSVFYPRVAISSAIVCTLSSLIVGLFGSYYRIVQNLHVETVKNVISKYFSNADELVNEILSYEVQSSAIWWFVACLGLLGLLFFRRPYTKINEITAQIAAEDAAMIHHSVDIASINDELPEEIKNDSEADETKAEETDTDEPCVEESKDIPATVIPDFDPCPVFTEIDAEVAALNKSRDNLVADPTLPQLVDFIVQYARNSKNHLFYTRESIAAFLAGLGTTRLSILQGMSGTGKTSLPKIVSEALGSVCDIVEVESSWRDKNELLGYYNEFSKLYTPKKFTRALYRASLCPDRLTFIVLDEMNLSRIEYYFSDFLSLMEHDPDKRELRLLNMSIARTENGEKLPYDGLCNGHTLKIPANVWFVGTANRDESTYDISDKVYDRAYTMNFDKRAAKEAYYGEALEPRYISAEQLTRLFEEAKEKVGFELEQYPVIGEVERILEPYNISFGNRIAMQIESFVKIYASCFTVNESVINDGLEIILLSKVVRKLELKRIDDKDALAAEFDKLHLTRCSEFIRSIKED